jgi:hypothetical protein
MSPYQRRVEWMCSIGGRVRHHPAMAAALPRLSANPANDIANPTSMIAGILHRLAVPFR